MDAKDTKTNLEVITKQQDESVHRVLSRVMDKKPDSVFILFFKDGCFAIDWSKHMNRLEKIGAMEYLKSELIRSIQDE